MPLGPPEKRRPRLARRLHRDESGASLVEFALVLPIFALLLFGMIDFGMAFQSFIGLRSGVNAGARVASIDGPIDSSCSGSAAMACTIGDRIGKLLGADANSLVVSITFSGGCTANGSNSVIVTASANLQATTGVTAPFLDGKSISSTSQLLLEQDFNSSSYPPGTYSYDSGTWTQTASASC